jgi:hypothetical protein
MRRRGRPKSRVEVVLTIAGYTKRQLPPHRVSAANERVQPVLAFVPSTGVLFSAVYSLENLLGGGVMGPRKYLMVAAILLIAASAGAVTTKDMASGGVTAEDVVKALTGGVRRCHGGLDVLDQVHLRLRGVQGVRR